MQNIVDLSPTYFQYVTIYQITPTIFSNYFILKLFCLVIEWNKNPKVNYLSYRKIKKFAKSGSL